VSARLRAAILLAVAVVAPVGCASVTLDVSYPDAAVNRAMLAAVRPRRVEIRPVADRRDDTARIGVQPEGDKPIVTSRPGVDIVRDDLVLAADVDEFWLDAVVGYPTVQYVGKVALAVALIDARTGEPLFTRRYVEIRRQQGKGDATQAGLEIMEIALSRVMHDLATNTQLAEAFGRRAPGVRNMSDSFLARDAIVFGASKRRVVTSAHSTRQAAVSDWR
jgi:hypothetical protein